MNTEAFGITLNKDKVDWKEQGGRDEAAMNGTPSVLSASGSPSAGSVVSEVRSHSVGVHCDRDSLDSEIDQSFEIKEDDSYVTVAESFQGISLSSLPKHVSVLERRKNAALEKGEPRRCPSYQAKDVVMTESLDSILKPHVSRLDREKAKYCQLKENKDMDRYVYKKKENGNSHVESLDAMLKKPVSKLEKYIQEFKEGAHGNDSRTRNSNVRKSKLQMEKEAATAIFGSTPFDAKQNSDSSAPKDMEEFKTEEEDS